MTEQHTGAAGDHTGHRGTLCQVRQSFVANANNNWSAMPSHVYGRRFQVLERRSFHFAGEHPVRGLGARVLCGSFGAFILLSGWFWCSQGDFGAEADMAEWNLEAP